MTLYKDYIDGLDTLASLRPKRSVDYTLVIILSVMLLLLGFVWLTPWVQTAQGNGLISTPRAENRLQAISALVPGQIQQWHVTEGQQVKQGDPLVTLVDRDQHLLSRLQEDIKALHLKRDAIQGTLVTNRQDLQRKQELFEQGISSARDRDQAQIKVQDTLTKFAGVETKINEAETKLARQSTQTKYAPQDGIVTRLKPGGAATVVKAGDVLATFIPNNVERRAVVEVTGLDAPLVTPGRKVRLHFDGWPVIQFSGWPSSSVGTFGGVVEFVEPMASANGKFRVWITEDPADQAWPGNEFVRLGSQVKAWVLLEEVRLGYEIWRQLNKFPPNYSASSSKGDVLTQMGLKKTDYAKDNAKNTGQ